VLCVQAFSAVAAAAITAAFLAVAVREADTSPLLALVLFFEAFSTRPATPVISAVEAFAVGYAPAPHLGFNFEAHLLLTGAVLDYTRVTATVVLATALAVAIPLTDIFFPHFRVRCFTVGFAAAVIDVRIRGDGRVPGVLFRIGRLRIQGDVGLQHFPVIRHGDVGQLLRRKVGVIRQQIPGVRDRYVPSHSIQPRMVGDPRVQATVQQTKRRQDQGEHNYFTLQVLNHPSLHS